MGQTFSTYQRDVARGTIYSSATRERPQRPQPIVTRLTAPGAPEPPAAPQRFRFTLTPALFPPNACTAPDGFASEVQGWATVGEGGLTVQLTGLKPALHPGGTLTLWLVRDLHVPQLLPPDDRAAIAVPQANQPGQLYTLDGQPATLGRADVAHWNTLSIAAPAGVLSFQPDGSARLEAPWTELLVVDPRAAVGLPGIQPDAAMPTGLATQILTATFMQPTTIAPHLPVHDLPARLAAVSEQILGEADIDHDGQVSPTDLQKNPTAYLGPDGFNRAMITLEPATRSTPALHPTLSACLAMGLGATRE